MRFLNKWFKVQWLLLYIPTLLFSQPNDKLSKKEALITLKTTYGTIYMVLFDETPLHKKNFITLAQKGFYDSTTFHRIIKGFMIQGGDPNSKDADPTNDGQGSPGYTIPAEFNPNLTHIQGAVAAARLGDAVNPLKESSGSQFYIVEGEQGAHFLNGNYTVFGKVVKGVEVVSAIASAPKDMRDRPLQDIKMTVTVKMYKRKKLAKVLTTL